MPATDSYYTEELSAHINRIRTRYARNAMENLNEHMSQAIEGPNLVHFAFVTHHVLDAMGIGPTSGHYRGIALDRIRHSQLFLTYNEYDEHRDNFNAALRFARERAANRLQPPRPDRPDVPPVAYVVDDFMWPTEQPTRVSGTTVSTAGSRYTAVRPGVNWWGPQDLVTFGPVDRR